MRKKFYLISILIFLQILETISQFCGQTHYSSGLIVNGEEAKRGEFPFLVSLILLRDNKFFCAANLITQKHALTASHCIQDKHAAKPLSAEDIGALLGKHNLKQSNENGAASRRIQRIIVHEDWTTYGKRYDADIAILEFNREVQQSEFIRTICLPSPNQQSFDLKEGFVVGWGYSERSDYTRSEDTPRKVKLKKPPTNKVCFLTEPLMVELSSHRTFCAGGEASGPCSGDSGGGFYIKRNQVWELQGLVSSSLFDQNRQCDTFNYAIFTNVALYIDWISVKIGVIRKYTKPVSEIRPANEIKLPCEFITQKIFNVESYQCTSKIEIPNNYLTVKSTSEHLARKSNIDVEYLRLEGNMLYIPSGIGTLFPNLAAFYSTGSKLSKLSKKNFQNMYKLRGLSLSDNLIEEIDENSFEDMKNIETILLKNNRLKFIPLNLLIHAQQLQHFFIDRNLLVELNGDVLFRNNPKLISMVADENKLDKIKMNFLAFQNLRFVFLRHNTCINDNYGGGENTVNDLQELQNKVNRYCP